MSDQLMLFNDVNTSIDIHGLILSPDEVQSARSAVEPATYESVLSSGADVAIRKTQGAKSELFVLLVSQMQFYIKNGRTGKIRAITPGSFASFFRDLSDDARPIPWLADSPKDIKARYGENLLSALNNERVNGFLRRGSVRFDANGLGTYNADRGYPNATIDDGTLKLIYDVAKELLSAEEMVQVLSNYIGTTRTYIPIDSAAFAVHSTLVADDSIGKLIEFLGREGTRQFIRAYITENCRTPYRDAICALSAMNGNAIAFDKSRMSAYLAAHVRDVETWDMYIHECIELFGDVSDKYPDNIYQAQEHVRVQYERNKDAHLRDAFARRAEQLADKTYSDERYTIRVVATHAELVEEGERMRHCVAQFAKAHAQGNTTIYLMRETSNPDVPCVTVEVRDGKVRQAFQSCNRRIAPEQRQWLENWCDRVGYSCFGNISSPLRV